MENEREVMRVLSEMRYEQEEIAKRAASCNRLTIALVCVLIIALFPVLVPAWRMVLVVLF
jgi:hypothetical protein